VEKDALNNQLIWSIMNLEEEETAVLSFTSQSLLFEDIFPIEVKFTENYSLVNLEMKGKPMNAVSGEEMSSKVSTCLQSDGYKISFD